MSKKRKHKYKTCIITFLDILGFKKVMENETDPNVILEKLKIFEYYNEDQRPFRRGEPYFFKFSDMAIRVRNVLSRSNIKYPQGILFFELLDLVHLQTNMVANDIFIRGAVVIDELYYEKKNVFGPGFNRAYKFESQIAKFPRIVIDPEIFKFLRSASDLFKKREHNLKMEMSDIKNNIRKDADGLYFIDYLRAIADECDDVEEYLSFVLRHKEVIVNNYKKNKKDFKIRTKTNWLIRYHNSTILKLSKSFFRWLLKETKFTVKDLLIKRRDLL
ncbi:MAG: hypothetical protein KA120_00230 [Candidatus Goldbacteria bacterium]|nr:hypothetical protein [Candidatus Goldiibacteriota bacterium]